MPTVTRPPSQLKRLDSKIRKAAPRGLPSPLRRFYAEGDGLTVTTSEGTATIVGLQEMFDRSFKPHKPITKPIASTGGRPFADRFFDDDFDFDEPGALERFNRNLRLKLLCSVAGESVDLAVDLFAGASPVLYLVNRGSDVLRLDLTFDDFVKWFSKFGTARWYYAFLEVGADDQLNIDIAAELKASLKPFSRSDVAPLLKVLDARTRALRTHRAAEEARKKKEEAKAAKPANIAKAVLDDLRETAETAKYSLRILLEGDALVAAIATRRLPPQTAWSYSEGLRVLPPELLPLVLAAPRIRTQDKLWARVDQLFGVVVPPNLKLDKLLEDAMSVHAVIRGEKVKVSDRVVKALSEWISTPPREARLPGTPERPSFTGALKKEVDYVTAIARHERDRLLALGSALVGKDKLIEILEQAVTDSIYGNDDFAPATMLVGAGALTFEHLSQVIKKTNDRGALLELARMKKWSGAKLAKEAKKLEPMGFPTEALSWVAKVIRSAP